jgi:F-type H+-transporting ATPase subunit a
VAFGASVAWAVLNVLVWSGLILTAFSPVSRKRLRVFGWISVKLLVIAGGFSLLVWASPLTRGQGFGVLVGISSVFLVALLTALGAWLTGTDLIDGRRSPGEKQDAPGGSPAGTSNAAALVLLGSLLLAVAPAPALAQAHGHAGTTEALTMPAAAVAAHGETAAAAHGAEASAVGHGEDEVKPELPNIITLLLKVRVGGVKIGDTHFGHFLHVFEYQLFLVLITVLMSLFIFGTLGLRSLMPGKMQAFLEMIVEGFYNFVGGLLGESGRKFTPFIGTLFVFIWVNNMFGLLPLLTGATSQIQTTGTLAVIVFFYVHYNGIRESGVWRWFHHLLGSPQDRTGWVLAPFLLVLHVIGELAKPLSLALRLFGNITGEHILSGVFLILGIMLMGAVWPHPWVGVPLHLPFLFLSLLVGTIQAVVFTLLSTIYLMLLLPHEEHGAGGTHRH